MQRENVVQAQIIEAWGAHPKLRIARINTGAALIKGRLVRFGVPGTADICGLLSPTGRFLAIECKTLKGKQRKAQETFERVVTAMGGLYILARDLETVDQALAAVGITR